MAVLQDWEKELYSLINKHLAYEREILDLSCDLAKKDIRDILAELPRQSFEEEGEPDAQNRDNVISLDKTKHFSIPELNKKVVMNLQVHKKVRELIARYGPLEVKNLSMREELRKIRDLRTRTNKMFLASCLMDLSCGRFFSEKEREAVISYYYRHVIDEEEAWDEFYIDFIDRTEGGPNYKAKKDRIGSLITNKELPKNLKLFLDDIKVCYLLGMNASVIGLSRTLLEIACQGIYDRISQAEKNKIIPFERKDHISERIKAACRFVSQHMGKRGKDMYSLGDKALRMWKESSDILHGKLPDSIDDKGAERFLLDIFAIVEVLYEVPAGRRL